MGQFSKKIYNYKKFKRDLLFLIRETPSFISAHLQKRISKSFATKIMLTVTTVNGCRYCSWFHTSMLHLEGVAEEEIRQILNLQFHERIDAGEIVGLTFAHHYAITDRNPDSVCTQRLYDFYGREKAEDIMRYINFVYFANLAGNTFDAFLSRLRGKKAPESSIFFEALISLLSAPLLLLLLPLVRRHNRS